MTQRLIKFRAWDKNENKMLFWDLFDMDGSYHSESTELISEFPVMQFTGLKDKNGKEIYEGDVVLFDYPYRKHPERFEVRFTDGAFAIGIHRVCNLYKEKMSIIGNIYESPNLTQPSYGE